MKYLPNGTIKEFAKTETINRLKNFKNYKFVDKIEDLSYFLFPVEYITGSYFDDNEKAKKFINDNLDEVCEIVKQINPEIDINRDKEALNNFLNHADSLIVAILIQSANYLITHCDIAHGFIGMFVTDEKINEMIEEIKTF